jgi:hypothetical protein
MEGGYPSVKPLILLTLMSFMMPVLPSDHEGGGLEFSVDVDGAYRGESVVLT